MLSMELILASGNEHKKKELAAIFAPHTIFLPRDMGIPFHFEEKGTSFLENAFGKAESLHSQIKKASPGFFHSIPMVLSDDSGLSVAGLGGEPGIFSARYGAEPGEERLAASDRNAYLLERMKHLKGEDRRGRFICCMVLFAGEERFFIAQETLEGTIADSPRGEGGFGYDPVFYIEAYGKTAAQLGETVKNTISHRAKAAIRIKQLMEHLDEK